MNEDERAEAEAGAFKEELTTLFFRLLYGAALLVYSLAYGLYFFSWAWTPWWFNIATSYASRFLNGAFLLLTIRELWTLCGLMLAELHAGAEPINGPYRAARRQAINRGTFGIVVLALFGFGAGMWRLPLLLYFSKYLTVKKRMGVCFVSYAMIAGLWGWAYQNYHLTMHVEKFSYGTFSAYGTWHPNVAGRIILFLFLTAWFVFTREDAAEEKRARQAVRHFLPALLAIPGAYVSYRVFGCRTGAVLFLLFAAAEGLMAVLRLFDRKNGRAGGTERLIAGYRKKARLWRVCGSVWTILPLLAVAGSVLVGLFFIYKADQMQAKYFSRRFVEFVYAYWEIGLHSHALPEMPATTYFYYFDSTFSWMIFEKGLMAAAALLLSMCAAFRESFRQMDKKRMLLLFLLLLYAVMERMPEHALFIAAVGLCGVL